jgi:hypothetical protein
VYQTSEGESLWRLGEEPRYGNNHKDWAIRMLTTLKGGASETERVSALENKNEGFLFLKRA